MSLRLPNGRDLNPRRWPCADGSQSFHRIDPAKVSLGPPLGNCARCDTELPGEPHVQELPCIYVDEGRLLCGDCGRMFSHFAHSCFLGQWIQERERWPLSRDDRYPSGNDPTSDPTGAENPSADRRSA